MTWIAPTLWDLLKPKRPLRRRPPTAPAPPAPVAPTVPDAAGPVRAKAARRRPMQERYDALVVDMKHEHGVRIRKWRSSMTGVAWQLLDQRTGAITRLIESPRPKGPMSCAIFLHEIGHHAIGFGTYRPRCLEEYYAWRWSLETMRERNFNVTAAVEKRMVASLAYAIDKAERRGLKRLPMELVPYRGAWD